MKSYKLMFALCTAFAARPASGQTCPPPPTGIEPSVDSKVSFDYPSGIYTYQYNVANRNDSLLSINYFTFSLGQQPSNVQSPYNWMSRYINLAEVPPNLRWATIATADSNSSGADDVDVSTPISAIQPGQALDGFSFKSGQGPGVLQYYAEGFTQVPTTIPTSSDDEPVPICAGWDFQTPYLKTLVTGMSVGPTTPNVVSVRIRLRKEDGEQAYGALNPQSAVGNVGVLVLSSRRFDASTITVSSIHFGPSGVSPLSAKLVPPTLGVDTGQDEREDWERVQGQLGDNGDQDASLPNLFLLFDLNSLGVQCILDRAIFLSAVTQSGLGVIGGVSTQTAGCDIHNPGMRNQSH